MTAFLDLFAGIGGFALGAYWAGLRFDRHFFSEVDPYAIRVYQQRFPDAQALGDIRAIRGADLPAGDWIIAGGFPCQDISVAGKGAGLAGARSGLWYEYARIIGELRPRICIMENVGALAFRGLDSVLGSLAALGYDAEWQDIRASDVGAPHRRERLWIVAYPDEERGDGAGRAWDGRAEPADGGIDVPDALGDGIRHESGRGDGQDGAGAPEPRDDGEAQPMADASSERIRRPGRIVQDAGDRREDLISGSAALADAQDGGHVRRDGQLGAAEGEVLEPRRGPQDGRREWWATEPDVGRVAHGVPARVDRLKCLGNSIVPQIAELIFSSPVFDERRPA